MRFDIERALVVRLLDAIGVLDVATSDPKKTYGRETGADVEVRLGSRKIGVQVTEYHGDAGIRGSRVRAREESDAARNIIRAYAVPVDAGGPLTAAVNKKVAKAHQYTFTEFHEVWLLIAAFFPKLGAAAATSAFPIFISAEKLERWLGETLRASKYDHAFLHIHLWPTVYEWSRDGIWQAVREAEKLTPTGGELWFERFLRDPEILDDPDGWALREAAKVLEELHGPARSSQAASLPTSRC